MLETLSDSKPRAKKEHRCDWCGGIIKKGEIYHKSNLKCYGELYSWKNHVKCSWICSQLNMSHEGNGITDEDFMDYVYEFLRDSMSEEEYDNLDFWGEDAVNKAIEILKEEK